MSKYFNTVNLIYVATLARSCNVLGSARWVYEVDMGKQYNKKFSPKKELLVTPCRSTANTMSQIAGGFTLVELMVVLSIAAILMAIGVPSYVNFITSSNISAESAALMGDLQYARSQAIKQGLPVNICAANTSGSGPYTCSGLSAWSGGWVTYTGTYSTASSIATSSLLRVQQPWASTDTMTSASGTTTSGTVKTTLSNLSFNPFGFSTTSGYVTFAPLSGSVSPKTVCISAVGNVQSFTGGYLLCP